MLKKLLLISVVFINNNKLSAQDRPSINHVSIYVNDLKKSAAFYHDIVLLDSMPEPFHDGKHIFFVLGPHVQLHLQLGADKITHHDIHDHLAFKVKSLDAFIKHLNKEGIKWGDWVGKPKSINLRNDGVKQIYFQDPDGYWIEVNNDKF